MEADSARIAVVGVGAVGTYFAAQLTAAGRHVVACARRPFERYVVDSQTAPVDERATCLTDPADLAGVGFGGPVDVVIVAVKGFQTVGTAGWLDALCGPDTIVIGAQNGIEAVERLSPIVNGARVVQAVVYCGCELLEPGHIRHDQHGIMIVPDDELTREVAPVFDGTAASWRPDARYDEEKWRKLAVNVMANGVTALSRRTMTILGTRPVDAIARDLYRECLTVGRADGADVDPVVANSIEFGVYPDQGTSMYYDVLADRPTEYDEVHGAALRAAARHDIDLPVTRVVHALLAAREAEAPSSDALPDWDV